MEAKKTSRSDLENKRFIFREIGFIVALATVFFAFETKYYQEEAKEITFPVETSDIEEVLPVFVPQRAFTTTSQDFRETFGFHRGRGKRDGS